MQRSTTSIDRLKVGVNTAISGFLEIILISMYVYETLDENFIGNIDSIKQEGKHYVVRGWVVPLITADACSISVEGFISIEPEERRDIYSYYKESHINYLRSGFKIVFAPTIEENIIKVNGKDVFKLNVEIFESVLVPSLRMKSEIIVTDNFYEDPNTVRSYALRQKYVTIDDKHINNRTQKAFMPSWIQSTFEKILNKSIRKFEPLSGVFTYKTANDRPFYHFDQQEYTGMICLSPQAPANTGISTYKSKITELTHCATPADAHSRNVTTDYLNNQSFNNNFYDSTNMTLIDTIANKYNRLIIYNSKAIHSDTAYFGSDKDTGNLFHVFFFNC